MIHIEGYRDLARIGAGGLGDVYRATRASTGRTVAVKVLRDVSDGSVAWHRTTRELTALVALSGHAHVIGILELLDLPSGPALVMEYAPGGSVGGLLARRGGRLTIEEAVLVGRHAASALVAAHEEGIVHRDVKPQNLLIDAYGQVKLCDFGIASLARSEEFRTRTNALSMRYASPEDLEDDVEVGPPADVYSLGATLLHLVHGAPPTIKERLAPWRPLEPVGALDHVLAACLRPEPDERPTAADVVERLDALDRELPDRCRALEVVAPVDGHAGERERLAERSSGRISPRPSVDDDTTSATLVRPDHRAPPRTNGEVVTPRRRRQRRRHMVVIATCAAAVIGAVASAAWLAGDDDAAAGTALEILEGFVSTSSPSTSVRPAVVPLATTPPTAPQVSITERAAGLEPLGEDAIVWPFGDVGGCLVQVHGVDELMTVECGEPHDLQRFAVDQLDPATFPLDSRFDASAVLDATTLACRRAFAEFVGIEADASELSIAVTRPSAQTWHMGDRRFQCLLGVGDAWLVGDAAASAQ